MERCKAMKSPERRPRRTELVASRAAWNTRAQRSGVVALCFSFGLLGWVVVAGVPPLPWRTVLVGSIVAVILCLGWMCIRLVQSQTALERFDNPRRGV